MTFNEQIDKFIKMEVENNGKKILNQEQASVFRHIISSYERGGTAFLQGEAGTGKGVVISAIKKYCDANDITCALTATTGKAGSAMGGVTIHSYISLSMKENNFADTVEDAFVLKRGDDEFEDPDILIIDEASMIGQKLLREIKSVHFRYILFVGDLNQLNPVKDKRVEWDNFIQQKYELKKVMRAKSPELLEVFTEFKKQKKGFIDANIEDYINDHNIVRIDYSDIGKMPVNTECTFVAYRNKLVEQMANKLTAPEHDMFNLNVGVAVSAMVVDPEKPTKNEAGYFNREFITQQKYFNGEDVKITPLSSMTREIVQNGYANYGKWKLKLTKNGIIITDSTSRKFLGDIESMDPKYFISFPQDEVLEYCTLSVIGEDTFSLVWDGSQDEFEGMLEFYFGELRPSLKKFQAIKSYYRKKGEADLSILDYDVRTMVVESRTEKEFMLWYADHEDTRKRKFGWKNLLNAKKVVSARPTTARTITKAQGISVPAVMLCKDSFFGAAKDAQYVAVSRARHGIIFIDNVPDDWKGKGE